MSFSRALLGMAAIASVALGIAVPCAQRRRLLAEREAFENAKRRDDTLANLRGLATLLDEARDEGLAPPPGSSLDDLVNGLRHARVERPRSGIEWVHADGFVSGNHVSRFVQYRDSDAWGRKLRYRCPGPVHRAGWDLWSVGADGINDDGGGDDIIIGGDVAAETSR